MSSTVKHVVATALVLTVGAAAAGAAFIWSGAYDIGADAKHTSLVHAVLETTRERSVKVRADKLQVPDLTAEAGIVKGAGNYAAMCVQCHMAPGMDRTELSQGLYPEPPNLTKEKVDPAHVFWVVKHGIKASAMPAWGHSMPDADIWNVAAFLQKLPELDQAQFDQMVAASGGHSHGGGESGGHHHDAGGSMKDHHDGSADDEKAHDATAADGHHADAADKPIAAEFKPASPADAARPKPATAAEHHDDGHKH